MVDNIVTKVIYDGDGKTTVFPFPFQYADPADVHVVIYDSKTDSEIVLHKDYYVDTDKNTVHYPAYLPGEEPIESERPNILSSHQKLVIYRETPHDQLVDLGNKYPLPTLESMPDKLTYIIQEIWEVLERCVKGSISGGQPPLSIIMIGGDGITFRTISDLLLNGTRGLSEGKEFKTLGYYKMGDNGGAHYICKYIWSTSAYPWAIDIGETNEIEYELVYGKDGNPVIDENTGVYKIKRDTKGKPIPVYESDGKTIKKKHLFAMITDKIVNYRQFGAKLDGITDDDHAIRMAHRYQSETYIREALTLRKHYLVTVANHEGIIRKDSNEPIECCGNIDLTGSVLQLRDCNATWYGFYLWGDNDSDYFTYEPSKEATDTWLKDNFVIDTHGYDTELYPNSILSLKEDPYAVRDDDGYLYAAPRYELVLHTLDGVLGFPFSYDWNYPGGLEISSDISDYETHQLKTQTVNSHFYCSYTRIPTSHYYFYGCDVKISTSANEYCTVLWCKSHNAHIANFNFIPDDTQMYNTIFKSTMIYIWGAYNVDVHDIVGFNAAGKRNGDIDATSGYVIRATNCLQLHLHDMNIQGYWGATAMNSVKEIHIERVNVNRLDIHNYFYNLYIDSCNVFNHSIQIGEGRGIVQITNSNFYYNFLQGDSYPHAHLIQFNLTYGRMFEGAVLIDNCNAYIKGAEGKEYDVIKAEYSPEAVSILDTFKFPEITIRNCHFFSYDGDTKLIYFMIKGSRKCITSQKGPTVLKNISRDLGNDAKGTLVWTYVGRGIDWIESTDKDRLNVVVGQFVRTYKTFVNTEGKTVFYDIRYFQVTSSGVLPEPTTNNIPIDYSGNEFTLGSAKIKYASRGRWESSRFYKVGDCCFTEESDWLRLYCYVCTTAGKSNGWRPTHKSGTVIEGEDVYPKNLDACYWSHVAEATSFITKTFKPNMFVQTGDILYANHYLYKVKKGGRLNLIPPTHTPWLEDFVEGNTILTFIGKDWRSKTWWAKDAYCLSYDDDDVLQVYQLIRQDGTTSGSIPVPGSGRCIDGDMIWENVTEQATKQWKPQTQFNKDDIVEYNGNQYKCVFDGRLELPQQINLEDIRVTGFDDKSGDLFTFSDDTDIPTVLGESKKWVVKIENVSLYRLHNFMNGYFGHAGNPEPSLCDTHHENLLGRLFYHAGNDGKIRGFTIGRMKECIPNGKKLHFIATIYCPSGLEIDYMDVSDFAEGRQFNDTNKYCNGFVEKAVNSGVNYIMEWYEIIDVAAFNSDDNEANDKVTYYCCSNSKVKQASGSTTALSGATLTVEAYA